MEVDYNIRMLHTLLQFLRTRHQQLLVAMAYLACQYTQNPLLQVHDGVVTAFVPVDHLRPQKQHCQPHTTDLQT